MNKHFLFMRDIVCKYHPAFIQSKDLQKYGLENSTIFNIERLIEECLAAVGGYDFIDEDGRDFNDINNSDSKTTTVIPDGKSKTAIISSIENKIGSLRVTIYNPFREGIDFMYIPRKDVLRFKEPNYGKNHYKEKIRARYNSNNDHYNSCEVFRVNTFEDLARANG